MSLFEQKCPDDYIYTSIHGAMLYVFQDMIFPLVLTCVFAFLPTQSNVQQNCSQFFILQHNPLSKMLHQAVNCLNCLLRWEVVAKGNFIPGLRFGRAPGRFKVHRHDTAHWFVISDPRTKHIGCFSTALFSLITLYGVRMKILVLLKRKTAA